MRLARLFRPFACEVFGAANGEEGLAAAAQERPDLILLDYNMPGMDGVSMLRRLQETAHSRPHTPVMTLSDIERGKHRHLARLGVGDCITKPFNERLLLAKPPAPSLWWRDPLMTGARESGTHGRKDPAKPRAQ